jgi:hypothetical protein
MGGGEFLKPESSTLRYGHEPTTLIPKVESIGLIVVAIERIELG